MKYLVQRHQSVVGLFLENAVAVPRKPFAEIRGPLLHHLPNAGALHLFIVGDRLTPAF